MFFVTSTARRQVCSTTPTMGRSFSACSVVREVVVTVPQAMRMAFRSKAVSYTHLAVYKRQEVNRPRRSSTKSRAKAPRTAR